MEEMNNNALKEYNDKALDACPNCARTFLPDRLLVHLKSCKGPNGKSNASP
jgi:zinc-finger of a C2HC-type